MAYSYVTYTGNGATTQYAVPFPYIRREHVVVTVDNVSQSFTWVNNSLLQLATAPANGVAVKVARSTPANAVLVDFTDGSTPVAADFDTSNLQHLYIEQELDDKVNEALLVTPTGLDAQNQPIYNLANPTNAQDAATKNYVDTRDALRVSKAGDSMTGPLAMGGNKITGAGDPTAAQDVATKAYVDSVDALNVNKSGDSMTGPLAMGGNKVTGVGTPTDSGDATTKGYADTTFWNKTTDTIDSTEVWSNSNSAVATTAAVNARIVDLLNDIGSYEVVASETTFPDAGIVDLAGQPDGGVLVAVTDASGLTWNGSGTSTNATRVNGSPVTITGITGTSPVNGCGMQVLSTTTLHTYAFVRFTVGTAVAQIISDNINEILQVDTNTAAAQAAASAAAASQSAAATSASNAAAYELSANNWATKTDAPVAGGEYSAKWHAQAAATSATNASNSATQAQNLVSTISNLEAYLDWGSITVAAGTNTDYGAL